MVITVSESWVKNKFRIYLSLMCLLGQCKLAAGKTQYCKPSLYSTTTVTGAIYTVGNEDQSHFVKQIRKCRQY